MKFREREIPGLFEIELFHALDDRGLFVKTFEKGAFENAGIESSFTESFYSVNKAKVIRGMHFQLPPHHHGKLVYCTSGTILDVILDLRKDSPAYGRHVTAEISGRNHLALFLPKGVAHGFCSLTEATMVYLTSTSHNAGADSGIRWDSFGMKWPVADPVISERDKAFAPFADFKSPF